MIGRLLLAIVGMVLMATTATAEPYGFGVAKTGGPLYRMATAIAKVTNAHAGLEFRIRSHAGSTQYMPLVDSGELGFGAANGLELKFAHDGQWVYDGRPHEDLRVVGVAYPFRFGFAVHADSEARTIADVKGMRLAGPISGMPMVDRVIDAMLANGGLTRDELELVPATAYKQIIQDFVAGRTDIFPMIVGSGMNIELERNAGELRVLPMLDDEEAVAAMRQLAPIASVKTVEPGPGIVVLEEPTDVMVYDFFVFTNKDVPEDTVYKIVKAMYENRDELAESNRSFGLMESSAMAPDIGVPYHPGAIRLYREKGIWPKTD